MTRSHLLASAALVVLSTAAAAAQPYNETRKLTAPDAAAGERFGSSVAVSGEVAFVGCHLHEDGQGAVYVFVRDAQTGLWIATQKLTASDRRPGNHFGSSVVVSGDVALVGSDGDNLGGEENAGSAHVFERDPQTGAWAETQKLTASDAVRHDEFGSSIAVSGDVALIGAPLAGPFEGGAAYVFVRDAQTGQWAEVEKLLPSAGTAGHNFGNAVAVSGDIALVGAPGDFSLGGSAFVFERDTVAGAWVETQRLNASDGSGSDRFGYALSLSDDIAAIGAWEDDTAAGTNAGSAYVFYRNPLTGAWVESPKLTSSDAAPNDIFGISISASDSVAVIGASGYPFPSPSPGAAYVFERDTVTGIWEETQKLIPSDTATDDRFGESVSVSGDIVLVGSSFIDAASGAAYVFERGAPTSTVPDDPPLALVGAVAPNPTGDAAVLPLTLATPSVVIVSVHDALGRRVVVAYEGTLGAGRHQLALPVQGLRAGVYAVRVAVEGAVAARMLTLLR